jgi:hypothetical protein
MPIIPWKTHEGQVNRRLETGSLGTYGLRRGEGIVETNLIPPTLTCPLPQKALCINSSSLGFPCIVLYISLEQG